MTDIYQTNSIPELMPVSELAAAYIRIAGQMSSKQKAFFERANASDMQELLKSCTELWQIKAVLLSVEQAAQSCDISLLQSILQTLLDIMYGENRKFKKTAAESAGRLLAICCHDDMSIWSDFLHKALFSKKDSGHDILSEDPLRYTLYELYTHADDDNRKGVLAAYATYFKSTRWDASTCLRLLSGIFRIPVNEWGAMQRGNIGGFIRYFLKQSFPEVRIASFYLLCEWLNQGWRPSEDFRGYIGQAVTYIRISNKSGISPAEQVLIDQVCSKMSLDDSESADAGAAQKFSDRALFFENLRSGRSWLYKMVNLRILRSKYEHVSPDEVGYGAYASHLLILLRLNPDEIVFRQAGEDILHMAAGLSDQQKYEIVKELFKLIETGYDVSYVPSFLGRFFELLSIQAQTELLSDLQSICSGEDLTAAGNALETICRIVAGLSEIEHISYESRSVMRKLCGMLNQSLYSDREELVRHVLFSAGHDLFGAASLPEEGNERERYECFTDLARNILICVHSGSHADVLCHAQPASDISGWLSRYTELFEDAPRPVAFYSGSFDPFSNGHYAVVREIAEMGYQVYVNVHDFAPARIVQPLLTRRQLAAMSVTDLPHVQLFPEEITINTENPNDLERLKSLFPGQDVWLVARGERVANDEGYNGSSACDELKAFPHMVFLRSEEHSFYDEESIRSNLSGELMILRLPVYYEHMTSKEIRARLRDGKPIDDLVSPQVKHYIQRHNLYGDDIVYKPQIEEMAIETEIHADSCSIYVHEDGGRSLAGTVNIYRENQSGLESGTLSELVSSRQTLETPNAETFSDSDTEKSAETFVEPGTGQLINALGGTGTDELTETNIRSHALLSGMSIMKEPYDTYAAILLDETLMELQSSGVTSASAADGSIPEGLLVRRGFVRAADSGVTSETSNGSAVWTVNMESPIVLFPDAASRIAPPFRDDERLESICRENASRLQEAVSSLYPGCLVLNINTELMNFRLSEKIRRRCSGDDNSETGGKPDANGMPRICVPFGKILKNVHIPGVSIMPLNSEKRYDSLLESFEICEKSGYPPLAVQMRTIRSMDRHFILVDDLYHKGYRMQKIGSLLESEGMQDDGIIVGVRSNHGKELAARHSYNVDAVYDVPFMKLWIIESDMIPFFGSDKIYDVENTNKDAIANVRSDSDNAPEYQRLSIAITSGDSNIISSGQNELPSVHPMLPYQMPSFLKDAPYDAVYGFSLVCMENAIRLFEALEGIYKEASHRTLTCARLKDVIDEPGYPVDVVMSEDMQNTCASVILKRDLAKLKRLKKNK